MKKRSKQFYVLLSLLTVLLIGVVDLATGEHLDLFLFYFVPVAIMAWHAGWKASLLLAVWCAVDWTFLDWYEHVSHTWMRGAWDAGIRLAAFLSIAWLLSILRRRYDEAERLNAELSEALLQIKQLKGILPMCSVCRKIRDENEQWVRLEKYISERSEAKISHGLCPDCYKKMYGDADGT